MLYTAQACDVCGCQVSTQGIGLLPQFSGHFAGIQYLQSRTRSDYPSLFGKANETGRQDYTTLQLWGRYQLSKRIQLFGFVPYAYNSVSGTQGNHKTQGIGDITLMVNYSVLRSRQGRDQLLLLGAGLKAPTGSYSGITDADRAGIPNIQTGTGAWDIAGNVNYTLRGQRIGYNADLSATLTTANPYQYKFGNRVSFTATGFYQLQTGNWSLLPQTGCRIEYALHNYDNYEQKWLNEQTGGLMCFAHAGMQARYRTTGVRIVAYAPVYQHFAAGHVRSAIRSEASFFILF